MKKEEKEKITKELLSIYPDTVCYMFNSNTVSAQNRKRYYWTNIQGIPEPKNKGIVLRDILEDIPFDDPRWKPLPEKYITEEFLRRMENIKGGACMTEARTEEAKEIRRKSMKEEGKDFCPRRGKTLLPRTDNKGNCITTGTTKETMVVYQLPRGKNEGNTHTEKAPTVNASKYEHNSILVGNIHPSGNGINGRVYHVDGKSPTLSTGKGEGPKVSDGFVYRKLTPKECERLQTLPDDYTMGVSDSRRYKAIGNGWTVDIISHILSFLGKSTQDSK